MEKYLKDLLFIQITKMKNTILILLLSITTNLIAQKDTLYYNSAWNKTSKKNAEFYRPMPLKKVGDLYQIKDYYINGNLQMEGFWSNLKNETFEGKVNWYYKNGQVLQMLYYKDGILDGLSTFYTKKGFLRAKGSYKNGDYYSGTFQSLCCPGRVTEYQEGKEIAYLTFYKNRKQLAKKEVLVEGNISIIQYFNKNGESIGEVSYKDDEAVSGTFIRFYMDDFEVISIKTSINYKEGKRNGELIHFDKFGKQIAKGIYKNNEPFTGTFYNDYFNTLESYKEGKKHGFFIQYDNKGKVIAQQEYDSDKKTGVTKSKGYFKNRTCTCTYKSGEPFTGKVCEDLSVLIYENGKIVKRETYKRDAQDTVEEMQFYNDKGEVAKKTTYHKDKQYTLTFKNGKPDNGQIYSEFNHGLLTYKEGRLNGPFTEHTYQDISIAGSYKDEVWDGTIRFSDNLSTKETSCEYKNGKPIEGTAIEDNCITSYENGLKTGLEQCKTNLYFKINNNYTLIYDNIVQNYKKGKLDGKVQYFKEGKLVSTAHYYGGHINQGTVYVKKIFENYYKNNKLVKSTYYFGNYKLVEDYNNYLIAKETTYKNDKIVYQGHFKNGEAYNGTFITIDAKEEPRSFTRTLYKNGKKHGEEQTINLIENTVEETNLYKEGVVLRKIKNFPFKGLDSIIGVYKKGKPFSGHFYSKNSTIEKIEYYKKEKKTGMQYYYSTTGSLLKPILDSINYVNDKPFDGVDIEVVNKDYHKHFYKKGKQTQIEIYDLYYNGMTDRPLFKIKLTNTGFITFKSTGDTFEKYNELTYTNKEKTEGKVEFFTENEKGYLQFKNSVLVDVQIKSKVSDISITMYLEKPNLLLAEAKFEDLRVKMYPEFKLSSTPNYKDFLDINNLFFRGNGVAHFYLSTQLLSKCIIKKGRGYDGIVIKQDKKDLFIYRKYQDGEHVKTRKRLTKQKLIELLEK
jgi:antitoxin component YwqK of YwqJK toxin-antitoxin module